MTLQTVQLSITLSKEEVGFIDQYRNAHALKSRSRVIGEAQELLRQRELEIAYGDASMEIDQVFDCVLGDGLAGETWSGLRINLRG